MQRVLDNKHYLFLLLAIIGGGCTFYFAVLGVIEHNGKFDIIAFVNSTWIDNYYAKSLTLDFWTGSIAGTLFIIIEGLRLKMKRFFVYILLTVFVAYAFGFPLFLFMRAVLLKDRNEK